MKNLITYFSKFALGNGSGMHRLWTDNGPMKSRKLFAVLTLLLFVGVGNVWGAADAVFSFALAKDNPGNAGVWTTDDIDAYSYWTATKGGSNNPAYYNDGYGLRIYNGGSFTITSTRTISSITLTFSGTSYTFSTSNTTNPQTVTPNAKSYTWAVSRTCRLQGVEITYSDGGVAGDYELLTDVSDLDPGDKIIILNTGNTYAISTTQNTNNRGQSSNFTKTGSGQATIITLEESTTVQVLGITESGASNHGFYALNGSTKGFLYATSSSSNYMGTRAFSATPTDGNGSWNITLNSGSGYEAVITAQGDKTHNLLKYNSSSSIFSCYASGQTAVKIYRKIRPCVFVDVSDGSTVILPAGVADYSTGDWKKKGAPDAYAAVAEHKVNGYCVTFTQAADYSSANGLQLKASAGIVTISGIKSTAGVDVDVVIGSGEGISVALTGADTKTDQRAGTTTITTYSTTADLTISKPTSNAGYIKTITIRPRSCNDEVALANGSPTHGTVSFSPSGPLGSCAGVVNTTMTVTPSAGYYLSAYNSTGVSTSNSPSIATSGSTSQSAQNINLSFAAHTNGTYTASATFSPILVNSLTLRAQQTGQSEKVGNDLTMTCYPKEGQAGGNDPLSHSLNIGLGAVLPTNALDKTYTWSVKVKASGDADWTNVGFTGNALNTNSIINSFNKSTGNLQIKATEGTAEIKITANDGSGVNAKVTITVANVSMTGVSVSPTEMEVYAGQKKPVTVTFIPANATNRSYTAGSSYTYVNIQNKAASSFNIEGKSSVTDAEHEEVVTVTTNDGSYTATIDVTVKPLPKVTFIDIVHDQTDFSGVPSTGILIATVSGDGLTVTTAKNTPTHSDLSTPETGNSCEKQHLHLVGWIDKAWADANLDATHEDIVAATSYFFAPNAEIDLVAKNGKTYLAVWSKNDVGYTDYVFSCAELTLEANLVTDGTPIFITSTANKKVRSQDYIQITGSGMTPNTDLAFPGLNSKFEIKTATYGDLATDADGAIDAAAYIFYTPAADATSDGLDKITGITVTVGGAKTKTVNLTQDIIGRHLPADFVIAGKKDGKWYALPSNMESTSHPAPSEIAVDNTTNPAIAYTDASNKYGLEGPTTGASGNIKSGDGQYVKLTMHPLSDAPLFGMAPSNTAIGKSGTAVATHDLSAGYWWQLKQTNTSITNPQDAKYTIYCANNTSSLSIKDNAGSPEWGLYASGVEELRLIPASSIVFAEAEIVEWGQHGAIIEVDATAISANKIKAILNEAESAIVEASQTGTSVKGSSTKYNYTAVFGDGIDFAATTSNGAMLTLEWYNSSSVLVAVSNINVPKIIAANATMSSIASGDAAWSSAEVHVLPGVTLEANAGSFLSSDVTIDQLEIYPGATVQITTGTLDVRKLVLRNGWKRIGGTAYNTAHLYIADDANLTKTNAVDIWYSDWYIDYDQYYPIAVPWDVTVANMRYKNTNNAASAGVKLLYYDGESRANNGQTGVGDGDNWKEYGADGNKPKPTTLKPGMGYAMTARRPTGKAFSIVRLPMTFSNPWGADGEQGEVGGAHKDQVTVTAYGAGAEPAKPTYLVGWNFIANPYMANYQGTIEYADETKINVVNIPDVNFKEYGQYATATTKLAPASGFLIQAPKDGTLTFGTANRKNAAPSYRKANQADAVPEQQAYIMLSSENSEDMMGIFVSEKYTADYDLNGDVEKLLSDGNTLRTYMHYGDMNMAYVAINEMLAREWIPVNVRLPQSGEYTFSMHEASIAGELEGVYLIDYANGNMVTNLMEESYLFAADAGTISGRFAINALIGEHKTPTGIDAVSAGADLNSEKPFKFVWHDKVYILHRGVIYDATGKRVREINK